MKKNVGGTTTNRNNFNGLWGFLSPPSGSKFNIHVARSMSVWQTGDDATEGDGRMSYQDRVAKWIAECLPKEAGADRIERAHRLLEEAIELAQACGTSKEDAMRLIDYVFDRPAGDQEQEVGGVMVTLAALCSAINISMASAADKELERNWSRISSIRHKNATKPANSPLPQ